MIEVRVLGGDIDRAILEFKKKVQRSGLQRELKNHSFFLTRTQKRKIKDLLATRKRKRSERAKRLYEIRGEGMKKFTRSPYRPSPDVPMVRQDAPGQEIDRER